MAFIRQRNTQDCGVAVIAMLCDVTYEEAERAIPWRRGGNLSGTTTKQLRDGAMRLGYSTKSTSQNRLKVVVAPKWWAGLPPPEPGHLWGEVPNNSLVKVPHPEGPGYGWHWVAWRKSRVYDPARGVFNALTYGVKPSSYMTFKKETT